MEVAFLEIDTQVLAWGSMFGLCEYRDDCWQMTEKGSQVVREYCAERRKQLGLDEPAPTTLKGEDDA